MKLNRRLLFAGLFIASTPLFANVNVTTGFGATADAALKAEIDKQFQIPAMGDFLTATSNAQSISTKGQGVSYATDHSLFVVGGGLGGSFSGSTTSFDTSGGLPSAGVGVQASVMAGVSLARFPLPDILKRVTVFVNAFSYSNDSLVDSLSIKTSNFGLHGQYQLIERKNIGGLGLLNWGGVAITSGFDVSSNSMTYKVGQSISAPSGGVTYKWTPDANSALALESSTFSVPIEVSSSIRMAYILSLFGGVGVDLNFGKSSIVANMSGPVTNSVNATQGSASLAVSENQAPSFGHLRFFAGPQLNLVPLRNTNLLSLYAQGNFSLGGHYGVHAGIRAAW